jgi:uncharacterized protein (DUF2336 family)
MSASGFSYLQESNTASRSGSPRAHPGAPGSIANPFANGDDRLTEEKVGAVDELLRRYLENWETRALVEMSVVLAAFVNASVGMVHKLAFHPEIAVARPVLVSSLALTTDCLVEIVKTKGQGHLLAVSERADLDTAVTDALVDRGNKYVLYSVAGNSGACFSASGFAALVRAAEGSERIAEKVGLRCDLPANLLQDLLSNVDPEVRARIQSGRCDIPGRYFFKNACVKPVDSGNCASTV